MPTATSGDRMVRTEVEVAADTVAVLLVRRLIPSHRAAEAAEAAGLMAGEVAAAVHRLNDGKWRAPRHSPARDVPTDDRPVWAGTSRADHPSSPGPVPDADAEPAGPPATITRLVGTCPCGKPIVRPPGARGPDPKRCAACRNTPPRPSGGQGTDAYRRTHPEPGKRVCSKCGALKRLADFNVKDPRTGNVDTYCRPCRHDYAASRYARVGQKVVTVELLETDPAVGALCPRCKHPFEAGQRVRADHLHHEHCETS